MKRNIDINDISKLYTTDSMVPINCNDCAGCSECCHKVDDTIILDPFDIYNFYKGRGYTFKEMMGMEYIALKVVDGIILPHINIKDNTKGCPFLNSEERCSVHQYRPGFCRLFPLGRIYREDGFDYFIQSGECNNPNKSKVKIKNWLGYENIHEYEKYIFEWHSLLMKIEERLAESGDVSSEKSRELNLLLLNIFFINDYPGEDFFTDFYNRKKVMESYM